MEFLPEIFILLMLAVAFLQSGADKIFDWKGNFEFMNQHFSKSPFKNMVKINLFIILLLELTSGVLSVLGIIYLAMDADIEYARLAAIVSGLTFGCLFTGQRLAKDYGGAQTIVIYLMPVFMLLWMLFK